MGTELVIVKSRLRHAAALAPLMRAEDTAEVLASGGFSPFQALRSSMRHSKVCRTALVAGEVAAIFGAMADPEPGVGIVWMLTGQAVTKHPRAFLRACRPALAELHKDFPILWNAIDARYEAAIRWARWLGGEVLQPTPFGVSGLPFCPVFFRRS